MSDMIILVLILFFVFMLMWWVHHRNCNVERVVEDALRLTEGRIKEELYRLSSDVQELKKQQIAINREYPHLDKSAISKEQCGQVG